MTAAAHPVISAFAAAVARHAGRDEAAYAGTA